jgi:hypothetical protein
MTDRELDALIITLLTPLLAPVGLARNYQQVMQGDASTPWVWFVKIGDSRHGYVRRSDTWDAQAAKLIHAEVQAVETTYQFTAATPPTPSGPTAADILQTVADLVQSDLFLTACGAADVGVLRVTSVSNPYIRNDQDRFEAVPTFDLVLTHRRTRIIDGVGLQSIQSGIYRT